MALLWIGLIAWLVGVPAAVLAFAAIAASRGRERHPASAGAPPPQAPARSCPGDLARERSPLERPSPCAARMHRAYDSARRAAG